MLPRLSRCLRFSSAALAHGSPLGLLPLQRGMATGQPAVALSQLQHVQWQKEPQGFVTVLLNRAKEFNTFNAQVLPCVDVGLLVMSGSSKRTRIMQSCNVMAV